MDHANSFLVNLSLVLGVAALTTVLFQKIRQPVVLGYLLAGVIIGPHVPIPLFANAGMIHELAELGVILIMFAIGLEFSLRQLLKMAPTVGLIAVFQSTLMIWLGYLAGAWLGWSQVESLCAGAVIAISSTTIIAKAFEEAGVQGPLSSLVFGILIVEDLIAILMLALFPLFFSSRDIPLGELAKTMGSLLAFLGLVMIGGMLIVPRLTRMVAKIGRPETLTIYSIGLCFSLALLAKGCGYSVALGAFLAGALIAESGEQHKVEALIRPVRDVFSAVFFVAVGMLIDPLAILQHWPVVLSFLGLVIVGKICGVSLGSFLVGYNLRTSIKAGMSLAQIGEFSFILAGVAVATGMVGDFLYSLAVAVSALTTLSTPWLIRSSDAMARYVDRKLPKSLQTFVSLYASWIAGLREAKHPPAQRTAATRFFLLIFADLALLGCILLGTRFAHDPIVHYAQGTFNLPPLWTGALLALSACLLAAPFVLGIVRSSRALGLSLASSFLPPHEDQKRLDLAATPRRAFVVTVQLCTLAVLGFLFLAFSQSFFPLRYSLAGFGLILLALGFVFWRNVEFLQGHVAAGAQVVLELLSSQSQPAKAFDQLSEQITKAMPGLGTVTYLRLQAGNQAVGKSLADLNLRGMTGASVIAIQRQAEGISRPSAHEKLLVDDVLVMTGSDSSISAAREMLV